MAISLKKLLPAVFIRMHSWRGDTLKVTVYSHPWSEDSAIANYAQADGTVLETDERTEWLSTTAYSRGMKSADRIILFILCFTHTHTQGPNRPKALLKDERGTFSDHYCVKCSERRLIVFQAMVR